MPRGTGPRYLQPSRSWLGPLHFIRPTKHPLRPRTIFLIINGAELVEQVRTIDDPRRDEMHDRHLGVLGLPFDTPFHEHQPRCQQLHAVARRDVRIDHHVGQCRTRPRSSRRSRPWPSWAAAASASDRARGPADPGQPVPGCGCHRTAGAAGPDAAAPAGGSAGSGRWCRSLARWPRPPALPAAAALASAINGRASACSARSVAPNRPGRRRPLSVDRGPSA
jgi:hypothetical protein